MGWCSVVGLAGSEQGKERERERKQVRRGWTREELRANGKGNERRLEEMSRGKRKGRLRGSLGQRGLGSGSVKASKERGDEAGGVEVCGRHRFGVGKDRMGCYVD